MDSDKILKPGDTCYVDANGSDHDCFGVVVDPDFWFESAKKENVLGELLPTVNQNRHCLFRVLGIQTFRQYWRGNDPEQIEPHERVVMHYRFQAKFYVEPVNLRPLIELTKIAGNRVGRLLLGERCCCHEHVRSALADAEVVYQYLDGLRFKPGKSDYLHSEDKLLRLLEKAVPIG